MIGKNNIELSAQNNRKLDGKFSEGE